MSDIVVMLVSDIKNINNIANHQNYCRKYKKAHTEVHAFYNLICKTERIIQPQLQMGFQVKPLCGASREPCKNPLP